MKLDSNFYRSHLRIVKQDADHYWVICTTVDGGEYRYCSDDIQFCRRCLQPDISPKSEINGVSYTYAASALWRECMEANGIAVVEKVVKINSLNSLCKKMNNHESFDFEKVYSEHPNWKDIPDPSSKFICHDGSRVIVRDGKMYTTKRYNPKEVERYISEMKGENS